MSEINDPKRAIERVLALADEMEAHIDYPLDDAEVMFNNTLAACAKRIREAVQGDRPEGYMDNPKALGAPANSKYGYLPCGCSNNGKGEHVR